MVGLDFFFDEQQQAESQPELQNPELLFSRTFFMGVISGLLLEKLSGVTPDELGQRARILIKSVPYYVQGSLSELDLCKNVS